MMKFTVALVMSGASASKFGGFGISGSQGGLGQGGIGGQFANIGGSISQKFGGSVGVGGGQ